MVAISAIRPNGFNPRKHFDEVSLNELAESIRQQGILQPVTVRHIADGNGYELVFGERRYRAATIVGMQEIPAIINDLTDEEAEEIAITENLQRKDVTPMEEANAYQRLMESGRHDLSSLAVQFGKSEAYIRTRLKFASLIPEIATLLETDEITVSVASEICRYGEDIQREVYEQHLKEDVTYSSWRGQKASEIARSIERQYTADLDRYSFDKTLCLSCPHNTNNMTLFCEGCGKCANRTCLAEMNASYLVEKALPPCSARGPLSCAPWPWARLWGLWAWAPGWRAWRAPGFAAQGTPLPGPWRRRGTGAPSRIAGPRARARAHPPRAGARVARCAQRSCGNRGTVPPQAPARARAVAAAPRWTCAPKPDARGYDGRRHPMAWRAGCPLHRARRSRHPDSADRPLTIPAGVSWVAGAFRPGKGVRPPAAGSRAHAAVGFPGAVRGGRCPGPAPGAPAGSLSSPGSPGAADASDTPDLPGRTERGRLRTHSFPGCLGPAE